MQAYNIPCGAGFRFDDALAEGDGIFADCDEVVAAYRVFPPQGGASDDRRNALGIIGAVDVQVSGKRHQYVARFEDVRHFVPVAQVLVQREVVDEDNRLLPGCGAYNLGDNPVENFSLGTSYLYVSDIKIVSSVIESFNLMLVFRHSSLLFTNY